MEPDFITARDIWFTGLIHTRFSGRTLQGKYLSSPGDHVGNEVFVSWGIHQGHHLRFCLKLGHAHVHCNTSGENIDKKGIFLKKKTTTCDLVWEHPPAIDITICIKAKVLHIKSEKIYQAGIFLVALPYKEFYTLASFNSRSKPSTGWGTPSDILWILH